MEIPIYLGGEPCGRLTLEKQGSMTLLRGEMEDPGRLVRLYVYGEGEGYLGVPQPEGGKLVLCRRLTPREMARLPENPKYAGEKGRVPKARPAPLSPQPQREKRHVIWQGGKPHYF